MNKPAILLIDDDETSRDVIARYLESEYDVDTTESGISALDMVKKRMYFMILMDINLGEKYNGLEITQFIKEMPDYKGVPVVAVTAYAFERERLKILAEGCDDYISKPFTRKEIIAKLKEVESKFGLTRIVEEE
ncbi:MAG: response regulator [Ignavibacteriaceae bacterium]|nr:response regulator [Ignavibacteriaceae bacterium]